MNRAFRTLNLSLNIFFIFLLSLISIQCKLPEKYMIEIPHSFYLNLTGQGQKPLELWHPRLILSQIVENGDKLNIKAEKRTGILKEKAYKGSTSFLEISSQIEPKVQSNKMSCACKFIPEFVGSEPAKESESESFIEKKDETLLIQTTPSFAEKNEEKREESKEKTRNYEEKIEKSQKKPEKLSKRQEEEIPEEKKKTESSKEDKTEIDKKELLEMYEKLQKLMKLEEETLEKSKNSKPDDYENYQPSFESSQIVSNKQQQPQKIILQDSSSSGFNPQQQARQKLILRSQQPNPYVLQPINNDNLIQVKVPQRENYVYQDFDQYYDQYPLQSNNNVRFVAVQQQQRPKYIVIPAQQRPQQEERVVYVDSNGEIVGY